ncbi:MAG: hypothetical protein KDK50_04410 [Chlamydiia bacterium]|nr:hypothetical protein [Chlamydiia bacterium]
MELKVVAENTIAPVCVGVAVYSVCRSLLDSDETYSVFLCSIVATIAAVAVAVFNSITHQVATYCYNKKEDNAVKLIGRICIGLSAGLTGSFVAMYAFSKIIDVVLPD